MIGIQVLGEFLELTSDVSINMEWNNPFFSEQLIPGSYSFPFKIPIGNRSEVNSRILSNIDVVENTERIKRVSAKLYVDGVVLRGGKLELGKIQDGYIAANFIFGLASVSDDIKTIKINEICAEPVVMASNAYTKRVIVCCNTSGYPTGPFNLVVNGRNYTGTSNATLAAAINADTTLPRAKATFVNANYTIPGYGIVLSNSYFTLEPYTAASDYQTELTIDLQAAQDFDKIHIDSSTFVTEFNDPVASWLNANKEDPRFRFPMLYNGAMYGAEAIKKIGSVDYNICNHWQDTAQLNRPNYYSRDLVFGGSTTFDAYNVTSVQPFIRLKWVIEKCAEYLGIGLEGDFLTTNDYNAALFYHSNALDDRITFIGKKDWLATRRSWNTSEFLPKITFVDLLKHLINRFCISIYFNDITGKLRFKIRKPVIESNQVTAITSLSSPLLGREYIGVTGIRLDSTSDTSDKESPNDVYQDENPEQTIPTNLVGLSSQISYTIRFFDILASYNYVYSLPKSSRPFNTEIPLVFIFDRGIQTTTGTGAKNYAAANVDSTDGKFVFSGSNGMFERRWKNWARFLRERKEISANIDFSLNQLMYMNWEGKFSIDRTRYMIKSVKLKITSQNIASAEVELYSTL